jgi:hypothetical protein
MDQASPPGANTDPGRVYLSLGPPNRITRIPSSRILVPLEIWYYDSVPGVLNTELRLIFYQKNSIGFLKLYSPTVDTIRVLLLPQASTNGMFGPNDGVTEATIRSNLTLPPAEDEVISAAVNVATGVKYSGNDEILGKITSPERMLRRYLTPLVESKFMVGRPKLDFLLSRSPYGGSHVDLSMEVPTRRDITVEVLQGIVTVYKNVVNLKFDTAKPVQYLHRLDLLPASYRVLVSVDGNMYPYVLDVPEQPVMSEIILASEARGGAHDTPYEFEGKNFYPTAEGRLAVLALREPGEVTWTIRRNIEIVWRQTTHAGDVAMLILPSDTLEPGKYELEATSNSETRRVGFVAKKTEPDTPSPALVSFNANLSAASRYALIGPRTAAARQDGRCASQPERIAETSTAQGSASGPGPHRRLHRPLGSGSRASTSHSGRRPAPIRCAVRVRLRRSKAAGLRSRRGLLSTRARDSGFAGRPARAVPTAEAKLSSGGLW